MKAFDEYAEAIDIVKEFIEITGIDPLANEKFLQNERMKLGKYKLRPL